MATTMHPNLVPVIPSDALPQTPAGDWADSTNGVLGAHVTRTPVGTPGPDVPGAFPNAFADEHRPGDATDMKQAQESLLESAKAYLPAQADVARALSGAKAYLPQGVAAYFPDSTPAPTDSAVESSLPPLPPSDASLSRRDTESSTAVDIGHGASVPYTESAPEPYSTSDLHTSNTQSSTAVDVGHGTSVPYTESAPEPYSTVDVSAPARGDAQVDVGHGTSVPYTASAPEPYSTTDLATPAREDTDVSTAVHTGHSIGAVAPPSPAVRAASGLLPSHPGVADGAEVAFVASPPSLTPQASTNLALAAEHSGTYGSTSSLSQPPSLDSGYAASSESALVQTPSSIGGAPVETPSPLSPAAAEPASFSSTSQSEGPHAPQNSAATGTYSPAVNAGAPNVLGSAALNSSDPKDLWPADTPPEVMRSGDPNASSDTPDANSTSSDDADGDAEDGADTGAGAGADAGGKRKTKKPKLMQRLKEKMHVGHGHGSA
ncbi:hypothetical protein FB451DRAFT_1492032 [Mycena latifolia]|nr:hypothetical protein FB451DRAFT_1492032 [Mycena latifolia]